MKKKNLLLGALLLASGVGFSQQQINNNDFENWENLGANSEEPNDWSSLKTANTTGCALCGAGPQVVWREGTTVHGGSYAARIRSTSFFGTPVNGLMTTGRVRAGSTNATSPNNHNYTDVADNQWNEAVTSRPDSVVYWVNYAPSGGDLARVSAVFHDNSNFRDPNDTATVSQIGFSKHSFGGTGGAWQRISEPVTWDLGTNPSYLLITVASSAVAGGAQNGSELFFDDMYLIYNVTPTYAAGSPCPGSTISVGWSTSGTTTAGRTFTAELSDENGSFASPTVIGTEVVGTGVSSGTITATIPTSGIVSGTGYKIRVTGNHVGYAPVEGTNLLDITVPTGTTTPVAVTNCTTPNGSVSTSSTGSGFELFTSGGVSQGSNGTGTFTGLNAGDYYIEVTESGCVLPTANFTINNGPAATAGTATPTAVTDCTTPDGGITVSGSTGNSFELFTSGGVSQGTNGTGIFTGLAAGDYYVTASNDCPGSNSTSTVTVNNGPTATAGTATPTAVTDCTTPDGGITVSGSTGNSFELFTSGGVSQGTNGTGIFTGLAAGDYYVTASNDCPGSNSTSTVTVNNGPAATAGTATPSAVTDCTTPDGGITVSGSTGNSFELFTSGGVSQGTNGTGIFTGLAAGDYYVTASNDCPGSNNTSTVTVNNGPAATAGTATPSAVTDCTTPDGGITVSGSTGNSFELFTSGGVSQGTNGTGIFTGLAAGDYYVTASNDCPGNNSTSTVTINNGPTATAGTATPTAVTNCTTPDGGITVSGSTGTSFELFTSGGVSQGTNGTGIFAGLAAGDYYVTASNDCPGSNNTSTVTVNDATPPTAGTAASTNVTDCLNPDGTITVSGASSGVTYELFIAGGATTGMTNATGSFTGLNAGDYEVVVSENGCSATTNVSTVNNASAPAAPSASGADVYCEGSTIADLTASGSGGTLTWYLGGSSVGNGGTLSPNTTAGTHTYSVTETVNNCESAPTVLVVEISENPVVSNNSSTAVDSCGVNHGTISVLASPSEGYELFDDNSTSIASNMTGNFVGLPAGDYTVEISNEACTVIENVTIDDNTGDHTVTVAPSATQNITVSTDGAELTPTESSNAEAREWLFTTTSGSGYQSFATPETGATYTPNFATSGTYYVICESTIKNCVVSSDEVQINVGDVGINEFNFNEMDIVVINNELIVDLSSVKADKVTFDVVSIDGKLILNGNLNAGVKNSKTIDLSEGIYVVNVQLDGKSISKKFYTK